LLREDALMQHPDELALAFRLVFGAVSVGALFFYVKTALVIFGG
jgi:hypothetical protein